MAWVYTLKEPGSIFMGPHASEHTQMVKHNDPWLRGKPEWRFEVPNQVAVVYLGALFLPASSMLLATESLCAALPKAASRSETNPNTPTKSSSSFSLVSAL
jgi:hypothetical protein